MKEYSVDLKKLERLTIYQLRDVGAKIGVKNPTALRADELRKAITDVVTGKTQPYKKNKSGRPHKTIIPDEQWDEIIGYNDKLQMFNSTDVLSLYSNASSIEKHNAEQELTGYVVKLNGELVFTVGEADEITLEKYAKITTNTQHYTLLKAGDIITCTIQYEEFSHIPFVSKIYTINEEKPSQVNTDLSKNALYNIDSPKFKFTLPQLEFLNDKLPIKLGQRIFINGERDSGQTYLANSFAKDLSKDYKVIYFAGSKLPEERIELENVEYFFSTFDISPRNLIFNYEVAFARAKNLANTNQNVVLIIDDLTTIMENYVQIFKQKYPTSEKEHYIDILQQLKVLLASSKLTTDSSLTLICLARDADLPILNDYIQQLDKLCNTHIVLDKTAFYDNKQEFYIEEKTYNNMERRSNQV